MAKLDLEALSSNVQAVAPFLLYYGVAVGALLFSLLISGAILPVINGMTHAEQNREE